MNGGVCPTCGEAIAPGKPFCASCGAAIDPASSAPQVPSPQTAAPAAAKSRKWVWWVAGGTLLLVLAAVGIGMAVMAQNRAAEEAARVAAEERADRLDEMKEAYEALVVVQSATEVGVNYNDYGTRVRDAAAALNVYEPADPEGEAVKADLEEAMDAYKLAGDAWETKFEEYESLAFSAFKDEHPELSDVYGADSAVQYYWQEADAAMSAAKSGVAAYDTASE